MPLNPKGLDVEVSDQESGQQAALQVQAVRQREDVRVPGLGPQVQYISVMWSNRLYGLHSLICEGSNIPDIWPCLIGYMVKFFVGPTADHTSDIYCISS